MANEKNPQEASNIFHSITKASVSKKGVEQMEKHCGLKVGAIVVPAIRTKENKNHQYVITELLKNDEVDVCVKLSEHKIFKCSELKILYPDL